MRWALALWTACQAPTASSEAAGWRREPVAASVGTPWVLGGRRGMLVAGSEELRSPLYFIDLQELGRPPVRASAREHYGGRLAEGVADINGDGFDDVLVAEGLRFRWFLGPDLEEVLERDAALRRGPGSVRLVDLSGDGVPEVLDVEPGRVRVLQWDGVRLAEHLGARWLVRFGGRAGLVGDDGVVIDALTGEAFGAYGEAGRVVWTGDVDGDGTDELLARGAPFDEVHLVGPSRRWWSRRVPGMVHRATLADVDGVGGPELVVTTMDTSRPAVVVDPGTGTLRAEWTGGVGGFVDLRAMGDPGVLVWTTVLGWWVRRPGEVGWSPRPLDPPASELELGDVDGDGDDEVVWLPMTVGLPVAVYDDGGQARWYPVDVAPRWDGQPALALGDFDGDGQAEVHASTTRGPRRYTEGGGGPAPGFAPNGGVVMDVDGDGADEIVARCVACASAGWPDTVGIYRWTPEPDEATRPGGDARVLGAGDLDGDGIAEIVVENVGALPLVGDGAPARGWFWAQQRGFVHTDAGLRWATWDEGDAVASLWAIADGAWTPAAEVPLPEVGWRGPVRGAAWREEFGDLELLDLADGARQVLPGHAFAEVIDLSDDAVLWGEARERGAWGLTRR